MKHSLKMKALNRAKSFSRSSHNNCISPNNQGSSNEMTAV